jgi:hypothetical protein
LELLAARDDGVTIGPALRLAFRPMIKNHRLLAGEPVGGVFDGCFKVIVVKDRKALARPALKASQSFEHFLLAGVLVPVVDGDAGVDVH